MQAAFCISRSLFAKMQKVIDYLAINFSSWGGEEHNSKLMSAPSMDFSQRFTVMTLRKLQAGLDASPLLSSPRSVPPALFYVFSCRRQSGGRAVLVQPEAISSSSKRSCNKAARRHEKKPDTCDLICGRWIRRRPQISHGLRVKLVCLRCGVFLKVQNVPPSRSRCTVTRQLSRSGNPADSSPAVFQLQFDPLFTLWCKCSLFPAGSFVKGDLNSNDSNESVSGKQIKQER